MRLEIKRRAVVSPDDVLRFRFAHAVQARKHWESGMSRRILLAGLALIGSTTLALGGQRVNNPNALIVRGVNLPLCDAQALGAGSNPQVGVNTDVQNLSVNCSPDGKIGVNVLRQGIPNPHICWSTLKDMEARNASLRVVTDPVDGNALHCTVNDITPNEMRKALHYKP